MESIVHFLKEHAAHSHWFILLGLLLAGCNVPISIDVLVIIAAILSSQFVPENTYLLYFIVLGGCYLSGWIAYFLGRTLGPKLQKLPLFKHILSEKKIASMQKFYQKRGVWAFIIGRFIPFGIRNCLFMTSGLSKMPFLRFILLDAIACFLWVTTFFTLVFHVGHNFETIWTYVKTGNIFIFVIFSIAVIGGFWYKRVKNAPIRKDQSTIN